MADPELEVALCDKIDDRLGVVHLERDPDRGVTRLHLAEELRHDDGREYAQNENDDDHFHQGVALPA